MVMVLNGPTQRTAPMFEIMGQPGVFPAIYPNSARTAHFQGILGLLEDHKKGHHGLNTG